MIPTRELMPQVMIPKMPRMRELMARPLVRGTTPGKGVVDVGLGGNEGRVVDETGPPVRTASSGMEDTGRQSLAPTGWTKVWPVTRRCETHCRRTSTLTGPYSFPSLPWTLYMRNFLHWLCGHHLLCAANRNQNRVDAGLTGARTRPATALAEPHLFAPHHGAKTKWGNGVLANVGDGFVDGIGGVN